MIDVTSYRLNFRGYPVTVVSDGAWKGLWLEGSNCVEQKLRALLHNAWFSTDMDVLSAAQLVCAACPERGPCLEFAEQHGIDTGVWGGLLPHERGQPARHQATG